MASAPSTPPNSTASSRRRRHPGLRDIEDDGETRELGMKKGASARSWGNLEDPNRTALIKTESFGTSEKYMSARI